LIWVAKK